VPVIVSPDIVPVNVMTCVCVPAGVFGASWNEFDSVELKVRLSGVPDTGVDAKPMLLLDPICGPPPQLPFVKPITLLVPWTCAVPVMVPVNELSSIVSVPLFA